MLKLIVAVLAVVVAGAAGAKGWKDLRVDASSESAFKQSLAAFNEELSPERRYVFEGALMDIWIKGTVAAQAEQRQFTAAEFYKQLDGLSYEEVVTLTDPSGDKAKERYREATRVNVANSTTPVSPWQNQYHASPELRSGLEHESLESADLMRTRQYGPSAPHGGEQKRTSPSGQ